MKTPNRRFDPRPGNAAGPGSVRRATRCAKPSGHRDSARSWPLSRQPIPRTLLAGLLVVAALLPAPAPAAAPSTAAQSAAAQSRDLADIQRLLDQNQGAAALEALEPILRKRPNHAEALLARSTAYFLIDQLERGAADLERALELDASLRQGWLNLGALRLAEGDGRAALAAFERARALEPEADDNALNIGTVRLLLGEVDAAREEYADYLAAESNSAEANLLVAKNFALANVIDDATRHARAAIERDERLRLRIRTDPAFTMALDDPEFQLLLQQDVFRPEPGSLIASKTYDTRYDATNPVVTGAVVDALAKLEIPFDPRIEATANWALLWGEELRIKIEPASPTSDSTTVTLVAPPRSLTRRAWNDLQDRVFGQIGFELAPKIPNLPGS